MKKKGFTLIEIIGVVVVLGVLALITVPTVNVIIKNGKQKALEATIRNLEEAAYNYSNRYDIGHDTTTKLLQISELKQKGYIKNEAIINPVTNSEMNGCIFYKWDENNKQYIFSYNEECVIKDLEVNITNLDGNFNDRGWANKDFYVNINTTGDSYKYCISDDKCEPTVLINKDSGAALITIESDNINVCVIAIRGFDNSDVICSDAYKLDKTAPEPGSINITGTKSDNDWYTSNVEIEVVEGTDSLSGHLSTTTNITSITENTNGTTVIVTTKDNADNVSTREYTIKVDKIEPDVEINKEVVDNKNVLTAKVNSNISGYTYEWYKDGNKINGATSSSYETQEAGTYKVVVTTGAGKTITSNEITIKSYTVSYNLNGATGSITSTNKVQDINTNITNTIPTRTGYDFLGWGTSSTDTTVDYERNSVYTLNENKTLYAIWKKTVTITFNGNGANVASASVSCDMYNADASCSITSPVITREGYTIIGYNTDSTATTSQWNSNSSKNVSENATYNAITSKEITVTFYRNNAASITPKNGSASTATSLTQKCIMWNTSVNCSITSPTITAPSNTPTVVGWDSTSAYTSNEWSENTAKTFNANASYYAVTTKAKTILTAKFNANGANLSSTSDLACDIAATYNGTAQGTSCTVTAPTITRTGYVAVGYNTSSTATTNNSSYDTSTRILTLTTSNNNSTWYAITKEVTLTLNPTSGTGYVGGSNLTSTVGGSNYGTLSCTSGNNSIATCSTSGTTLIIKPGNTIGETIITLKESNANKTATYTVNVTAGSYAATPNYSCSNGTLSGTNCIQTTSNYSYNYCAGYDNLVGTTCYYTYPTSASIGYNYTCQEGYIASGSGSDTECSKEVEWTHAPDTGVEYTCPDGYTSSGTGSSMTCTKYVTETISATATTTKSCPSPSYKCSNWNDSSSHEHCITENGIATCPSGYVYENATTCIEQSVNNCNSGGNYEECVASKKRVTRTCTSGGTVFTGNGIAADDIFIGQCISYSSPNITTTYTCPDEYTKSGSGSSTKCSKSVPTTTDPNSETVYTCPDGYMSRGSGSTITCYKYITKTTDPISTPYYYCSSGYLEGENCILEGSYNAYIDYTCPDGYESSGSGINMTCTKTTSATVTYTCPNGGTLSGTTCVK